MTVGTSMASSLDDEGRCATDQLRMTTLGFATEIRNRYVAHMPSPATPPETDFEIARVERSVHVDAPVEDVWSTIAEPDELSGWLGGEVELDRPLGPGAAGEVREPDGSVRHLLVTDHEPGRRLVWHWHRDGEELSSVEITVRPDGAGTEVRVVEVVALTAATAGGTRAFASAAGGLDAIAAMDRSWSSALPTLASRLARKLCPAVLA
jgi:uncharacterized protein YndB with AHSA1/START domain